MSFHPFQCCRNFIDPDILLVLSFISFSMYSFHESLIPFSSAITLPDTPFRQFDPIISCLSFIICFTIRLGSFKSLAHSYCFFPFAKEIMLFVFCLLLLFPFAKEIMLFVFCLLLLYSFHASANFSFFQFPYFFFFFLTASATSSFHHVSLCLHGPFDNPQSCAVSIIIFFHWSEDIRKRKIGLGC